jgi:hypothetical protein
MRIALTTTEGQRLDRHGAARITRPVTRRAGIVKHVSPHTHAHERWVGRMIPLENLRAMMAPGHFDDQLLDVLSPAGGVQTFYSLVPRLLGSVIPLVAMHPFMPMQKGPDGGCVGLYWSRALATAVAVALSPANGWQGGDESTILEDLARRLPGGVVPDLIERARERNVQGWLWELPGIGRDEFPG